ncbi:hypothetical protein LJK87_09410 [Paenibacillus sp. P25]|nr:hypothetical protein LJK87_09410 [Paenibacillus sp. P25]
MTFSASDIWFVLVLLLFIAAFLVMVTFYANEGKDERGRHIVSTAAGWTYPVLLIGWGRWKSATGCFISSSKRIIRSCSSW